MKVLSLFIALIVASMPATGENLKLPITLGNGFIKQQIVKQVFTAPGIRARVWRDQSGCNWLHLLKPDITSSDLGLTMRTRVQTQLARESGGECIALATWTGTGSLLFQPYLSASEKSIRIQVIESNLTPNDDGSGIPSQIWKRARSYLHPHLEQIRIDLGRPLAELRATISALVDSNRDHAQRIIDSIALSAITTGENGVRLMLSFNVPEVELSVAVAPEPPLTQAELEKFDRALAQWDVFITQVIKRAAIVAGDLRIKQQLLDILLQTRYELVSISADPPPRNNQDPVRRLFVSTWEQLAPVLQQVSAGLQSDSALQFITFIAAADALKTMDALGPGFNVEISSDALRRMIRLINPDEHGDPLRYNENVDPELREIFDFGAPLPPRSRAPTANWLIRAAWTGTGRDQKAIERLNLWLPTRSNLRSYLLRVRWLLEDTAGQVLARKPLESQYHQLFQSLVLAAAWQETCWRQYINNQGKRWPIRSSAGAVGMMQVLPRIWRGFYDPHKLAWDIAYNTNAGGEILHHYLVRYALRRGEHKKTSDLHNLARASYAAYHGGPKQMTRYRSSKTPDKLRRIDESFWRKYQIVHQGNTLAVSQCYGAS